MNPVTHLFPFENGSVEIRIVVFTPLCSCVVCVCAEEACEDSLAISAVRKEKKLLNGMIQNLLPAVGSSVRTLSLAYSAAVSSKMVRKSLRAYISQSRISQTF